MTLHDTHLNRLADPALRSYVIAAAAALAVVFVVQFDSGSLAAAGVPILCGVAGLLLRWTAMPIAFLITLGYFLFFPVGIPLGMLPSVLINESYFNIGDLILVPAAMTYLLAQYRLFDLTYPAEKDSLAARPSASIEASELKRSLIALATMAILGQALWWLLTNLEVNIGSQAPLRWTVSDYLRYRQKVTPPTQSPELSRFLLLVLLLVSVAALARLAFWYLRLAHLKAEEARLILLDVQWQEHRRELARLETWRSYRLGHLQHRRGSADRIFRGIVRAVFLAILCGFLAWMLSFYFTFH